MAGFCGCVSVSAETVSGLNAILGRFVSGRRNPVSPMQIDLGQLAGFDVSMCDSPSRTGSITGLAPAPRTRRVATGRREMDASLLIGAPIGLGILLAFGIVMVALAYLAQ